ncbi:OLC1v1024181C2 [Oldenlandia corymbosa var. corymbosa]|uniref:OLC1v1024181C2 n=1 Tax=Oldenlandia corymbosa var. corymbosa TaxID=529605 RepID=A0AAV1C283_OLDCO|nr:OLC1v1024181C2 [Oldenlandia corymbosa var. corymbosa]
MLQQMAEDVVVKDKACKPCCQVWEEKYSKMKEKFLKSESIRKAFKDTLPQVEQRLSKLQAENSDLKKACDKERARAESEKEDKEKENTLRVALENEISALKTEILSLQENGDLKRRGLDQDVASLQQRILEAEAEVLELKGLLQMEKEKVVHEKEKVDMERKRAEEALIKVKAEMKKASEVKRLTDIEKKKDEKFILQIESLRSEADETKSKLALQTSKYEEEIRKLKAEIELSKKERDRAKKEMASEKKRLTDIEKKKDEKFRLQVETLRSELNEAKSKLSLETTKYEEEIRKLKAENGLSRKDREQADREMAKNENLRKLVEANRRKAMDERSRADRLSQQLDETKKRLEDFEKEFSRVSITKLVEIPGDQPIELLGSKSVGEIGSGIISRESIVLEARKKQEGLEKKIFRVKKQVKSERKKAEEQMRVAEVYKSKALEERNRAEWFSYQLDANKQKLEEIQNKVQELISSVKVSECFDPSSGGILQESTAEIKFLRKQLKFEKMRVKHANEVSKMEMDRNQMLRREIHCIKQEFLQFLKRLDILDQGLFLKCGGMNDLEKVENPNLEQGCFHTQPSQMILETENEFVKHTSSIARGPGPTVLIPPVSGEICTGPLTGTDSSLDLLLRSSSRNVLQTSALNSSSASFSDRTLVGSQEKGTSSITAPALFTEEQNLEPYTSSLSDVTRKSCDEKIGTGAVNSVGSPIKFDATERSVKHKRRKRKRFPDVGDSIEKLYSASRKLKPQVIDNLTMLHGILNGESLNSSGEETLLVPKLKENVCSKLARPHKKQKGSNIGLKMLPAVELKSKHEALSTEISEGYKMAYTIDCNKNAPDLENDGDFELLDQGVMALVDLDNDKDENFFRKAIKEPVAPLSPSFCNIQFPCTEATENQLQASWSVPSISRVQEQAMPSNCFDVINIEIDSNEKTLKSLGTSKSLFFETCEPCNDSRKGIDCSGCGSSGIENSGQIAAAFAPKDAKVTSDSRGLKFSRSLQYCVVSPNNIDTGSIHRIFHACHGTISQISGTCLSERLILTILLSLQQADGLSVGERASVLFSLLLHYIPEIAIGDFRSFSDAGFLQLIDSCSQQWCAVLSDVATKRMLLESCDVDELLALIESFLLNGTILMDVDDFDCKMNGCCSGAESLPNDKVVFWSVAAASTDVLFAGGLLLALICVSIDRIGSLCEISYHLLCQRKINISFVLKLLHAFAYLAGPKYFTLEDYGLVMYVQKSLVGFLERLDSLPAGKCSCLSSVDEKSVKISACGACPFSQDVASVDSVVSLLLEKLQSYASSVAEEQDLCNELLSSNSVPEFPGTVADVPGEKEVVNLNFESNQQLCWLLDILSLVELVAKYMTWDWTFSTIILCLLKILDSSIPGYVFAALIALLGRLGRIGVDAKGYGDSQVDILRNWLVGVLCSTKFKTYGLPIQFASVTALIALVDRPSIEDVDSSFDSTLTDGQSSALTCLRKWFSSLSMEEQSSFRSLQL